MAVSRAKRPQVALRALNLNTLSVLDALVQFRSVSRAANELGVTQSAGSHALQQLRHTLGDDLVVRTGAGMEPRPFAERLAERVHDAFLQIETALSEEVAFDPATAHRTFTIAAEDHMAAVVLQSMVWMAPPIAPDIAVRIVPLSEGTAADLARGSVDLVIASGHKSQGLKRARLIADRFCCLVRRGHPQVRDRLTLEQLTHLPHVLLSRRSRTFAQLDDALHAAGVQRRIAVELPYLLLAPTLVPFTGMVLIVPRTVGELFALGYPLQVLEPPLKLPPIEEHMYWHPRFTRDPAHLWLRKQMSCWIPEFFARIRTQSASVVGEWPDVPTGHRA